MSKLEPVEPALNLMETGYAESLGRDGLTYRTSAFVLFGFLCSLRTLSPLLIVVAIGLSNSPANASSLRRLINNLGRSLVDRDYNSPATCNGRACFNPGPFYGDWRFDAVKTNSSSSQCIGIYKRTVKYFQTDWHYQQQTKEGECPQSALRTLIESEKREAEERYASCKDYVGNTYRKQVGRYVDTLTRELCPSYSQGRDFSHSQADRLATKYSDELAKDKQREADAQKQAGVPASGVKPQGLSPGLAGAERPHL